MVLCKPSIMHGVAVVLLLTGQKFKSRMALSTSAMISILVESARSCFYPFNYFFHIKHGFELCEDCLAWQCLKVTQTQ